MEFNVKTADELVTPFLLKQIPSCSKRTILQWIKYKRVVVNGKIIRNANILLKKDSQTRQL